jgi:hypothetical protein
MRRPGTTDIGEEKARAARAGLGRGGGESCGHSPVVTSHGTNRTGRRAVQCRHHRVGSVCVKTLLASPPRIAPQKAHRALRSGEHEG